MKTKIFIEILIIFLLFIVIGFWVFNKKKLSLEPDYLNIIEIQQNNTKSFIGKVLEETTTYMIVEPNEDEIERKSSDKIVVHYKTDHIDYLYGIGRKVLITYNGLIMESYPAQIYSNNILTEGYLNFELTVKKSASVNKRKILNNSELSEYNADFNLYYYGLEDVEVKVNNLKLSLEEALKTGKVSLNGIISKANEDIKKTEIKYSEYEECQSVPKLYPYSDIIRDGGSIIYYYEKYTIIKYHTLDGNRDVYIGIPEITLNIGNL